MGEALAMMEIFLIVTSLVQRFEILPEEDNKIPKVEGTFGLTWMPKPFYTRAVPVQ